MSNPMAPFLKAGLTHYPAAIEAVSLFEKEAHDALEQAATAKRDWTPLTDRTLGSRGTGSERGSGCWIYRLLEGRTASRMRVEIDMGLWWGSPGQPSAILYSRFREPSGFRQFQATTTKHVSAFVDGKDTYLSSAVPENLALTEIINRHLDILLGVIRNPSGRKTGTRQR